MIGLGGIEPLHALHYISKASEHILHLLGSFIAYIGKRSESGDIGEIFIIERTHVNGNKLSLHDPCGGFRHILRNAQAGSEIVHRTGRDISQRNALSRSHKRLYSFVKSAVSSAAHHGVEVLAP